MPIYDINMIESAGFTPSKKQLKYANAIDQNGIAVTRNPKLYNLDYSSLLDIMRNQNRIETIERYMWTNVPFGLTPDLIERVLFYRGTGCFYYNKKIGKFQFLPYALNKTIDEYGRYTACNTLPFTGVDTIDGKGKSKVANAIYQDLEIVWDLPYSKDMLQNIRKSEPVGIILHDSTLGVNQQPIIRSMYVEPVIRMLATLMNIINSAMFGAADANILNVDNESEYDSIKAQISAINTSILKGERFIPVISKIPITPIKTSNTADLEGLFNTFNSLTNFLKSITGIANPGVFDKKAHLLQEEQQLNGSNADDIYYNGLRQRQEFCIMVQAYYGYPIWCESKRGMSEVQAENIASGETSDADNTQFNDFQGGKDNGTN